MRVLLSVGRRAEQRPPTPKGRPFIMRFQELTKDFFCFARHAPLHCSHRFFEGPRRELRAPYEIALVGDMSVEYARLYFSRTLNLDKNTIVTGFGKSVWKRNLGGH